MINLLCGYKPSNEGARDVKEEGIRLKEPIAYYANICYNLIYPSKFENVEMKLFVLFF